MYVRLDGRAGTFLLFATRSISTYLHPPLSADLLVKRGIELMQFPVEFTAGNLIQRE